MRLWTTNFMVYFKKRKEIIDVNDLFSVKGLPHSLTHSLIVRNTIFTYVFQNSIQFFIDHTMYLFEKTFWHKESPLYRIVSWRYIVSKLTILTCLSACNTLIFISISVYVPFYRISILWRFLNVSYMYSMSFNVGSKSSFKSTYIHKVQRGGKKKIYSKTPVPVA